MQGTLTALTTSLQRLCAYMTCKFYWELIALRLSQSKAGAKLLQVAQYKLPLILQYFKPYTQLISAESAPACSAWALQLRRCQRLYPCSTSCMHSQHDPPLTNHLACLFAGILSRNLSRPVCLKDIDIWFPKPTSQKMDRHPNLEVLLAGTGSTWPPNADSFSRCLSYKSAQLSGDSAD